MGDFKRTLSLFDGLALAISFVVGSGLLGLPGIVLQAVGPNHAALAWVGTSLAMLPLVIIFSKLGTAFPNSSGLLYYVEYAFGKAGRNGAGMMGLASFCFGLPALLLIGGSYLQVFLGVSPKFIPALSILILTVSISFNILGAKTTAAFNAISTLLLLSFILVLCALNQDYFFRGLAVARHSMGSLSRLAEASPLLLWKGSTLIFWAYLGWENLSFGVQEIKDPKKTVPLIFGLSYVIVVILYLLLAFTTIGASEAGYHAVESPSGLIALLEGSPLKPLYLLIIVFLMLGNANAWVYSGSRFFYAEAKEGHLPRALRVLSPKQIPVRCLVAMFVVALVSLIAWDYFGVTVGDLILVSNQSFIFLFLASVWAYWKVEMRAIKWVVASSAVATCSLFLTGFNFWILFPLALVILGALLPKKPS